MVKTHPQKIVSVVFWSGENGKEPVREWLKSLTKGQKKIIGEDIKTVEIGWPLGMPLVKNVGKGIWEVRSSFRGGIARVLFKMHEHQMVLLHGFIKKSQKTPSQDLALETVCKLLSPWGTKIFYLKELLETGTSSEELVQVEEELSREKDCFHSWWNEFADSLLALRRAKTLR